MHNGYREYKTHFEYSSEDGFYYITEVFERIKIYTKEGYDHATKTLVTYQSSSGQRESVSSLKGNTYFLNNGKVEKAKLGKDGVFEEKVNQYYKRKKFTMPDLKEGCVIEYKYNFTSPFKRDIDTYRFQEKIPVNQVQFWFYFPEYFGYKTHKKGFLPINIKKDGQEKTLDYNYMQIGALNGGGADKSVKNQVTYRENSYEVSMKNVPPVKEEAFSGNIDNYLSGLKFELAYTKFPNSNTESFATSWDFVAKSIYESPSFGGELEKSNYFKADIDNLLSGVSNENQKMELIFNYVKSRMNWNSFIGKFVNQGVKKAYKEKVGNVAEINLMLTAMFRYAHLNANPVLVSTKKNGIPVVATRNGFNYVISAVEVNNGVYLFDASNKNAQTNILNSNILNWQGRLIREDGSSTWVALIPSKHAVNNVMLNAIITEDLNVKGDVKKRVTGHLALEAREKFRNRDKDDIRKELEKDKIETELSNVEIKDLENLDKPVSFSYSFESFNLVEEIEGKLYVSPMLFMGEKGNPFISEERIYPVDFGYPKKMRALVSINIPEGYTVEQLPESTSFSFGENDAVFRYKISSTASKIQLSLEFSVNQPLISASDYKNLKGFYQLMVEKQNEKVVLSKI